MKKVLVIGANSGIGRAVCHRFTDADYNVYGTVRELSLSLEFTNGLFQLDLADTDSFDRFCEDIESVGAFDVVIFNAGIIDPQPFGEHESINIDSMFCVNTLSPLKLLNKLVKASLIQESGKVVFIGSIASVVSKPTSVGYSASKSALVGAIKALSLSLAERFILVNMVSPGPTKTAMLDKNLTPQQQQEIINTIPLKRLARPEEVAQAVYFIGSEMNTYITGQNIILDGGFTSR